MTFEDFKKEFQKKRIKTAPHKNNKTPVVSVCVQTYNQVKHISQCLESILMQKTDFPFEILLGEDDSSDGTRDVCIDFAQRYPEKIRLFLHERENNIKINGYNTGIFNSIYNLFSGKGKYIAYCDGDDLWTDPQKLQQQVDFLEKNEKYVFTYHRVKLIDDNGNEIKNRKFSKMSEKDFSSSELKQAIMQPPISTWCFRNIIREIPIQLTETLNADNFWISLLGHYGDGKFLPEVGPSCYRIHRAGIWSSKNKDSHFASKMATYRIMSEYYEQRGDKELSKYFAIYSKNYAKMLLLFHIKKGNFKKLLRISGIYLSNNLSYRRF